MEIFTIGFTQRSARDFFVALKHAGIKRLIDVRLHNSSQLAGFSKSDDLAYFLQELCGATYVHELLLAPSPQLFDRYKKHGGSWSEYKRAFLSLLDERQIATRLDRRGFDLPTVLLCSEPTAERCHRRLVAEYLQAQWGDLRISHL